MWCGRILAFVSLKKAQMTFICLEFRKKNLHIPLIAGGL